MRNSMKNSISPKVAQKVLNLVYIGLNLSNMDLKSPKCALNSPKVTQIRFKLVQKVLNLANTSLKLLKCAQTSPILGFMVV